MSAPAGEFPWRDPTELSGPLAGIRIVDLTAFAVGPWACSLLADLGADVIKIDPPYGDHIREVKPARLGEPTTYSVCNLGKRCIVLDLKEDEDRAVAHRLVAHADVVMENSREGAMDRIGMGYETLRKINHRLIYATSSSFGSDGPLARVGSTDPQGQAFSGLVSTQGAAGGRPEFLRYFAAMDLGTSSYLASAVLLGLYWRTRTGTGSVIKTSQMECSLAMQTTRFSEYLLSGQLPSPLGTASPAFAPSTAFECRDRTYLMVSTPDEASWRRLCVAIDRPELTDDARFVDNLSRVANRETLSEALGATFAAFDAAWWKQQLTAAGVAHGVQASLDELMRGGGGQRLIEALVPVPHPIGGTMRVPRTPWRFGRTPAAHHVSPTPGQNADVVDRLRTLPPAGESQGPASPPESPPLDGLRVLEIAQGISGPYCGLLLQFLGAKVAKAEPAGGDYTRGWAPALSDGVGVTFHALNRGKAGIAPEQLGIDTIRGLADVVILDGNSPWPADGDLDGAVAALVDAGLVVLVVAALEAGSTEPATELELQAAAGLMRYIGQLDAPPVRVGADLASTVCGVFGLQAILAALLEGMPDGRGQRVDVGAFDAQLALMSVVTAALDQPDTWEGFHLLAAANPRDHGVVTSDGAIAFSPPRRSNEPWIKLCHDLGADALLNDPRFATPALRTPRSKELNREMSQYTEILTTEFVLEATHRNEGLAVPVQTYPQVADHPQVQANDMFDPYEQAKALAAPWRINGDRPHLRGAPPAQPS